MREIKFRAWDEQNHIMHTNFQFIVSGNEGNDWIVFISDQKDCNRENGLLLNDPFCRLQLKVMQFTGLKDKNGKEIYEGDILRTDEGTRVIEWDGDGDLVDGSGSPEDWIYGWKFPHPSYEGESMVVIGNIHENPELLEKLSAREVKK